MITRLSTLFLRTLRENPADARSGRVDRERSDRGRLRDRVTVLPHDLEMPDHRFSHDRHAIIVALRGGNTSGQVRAPGPVRPILGTLDNNDVSDHRSLRVMPACFRMLRSVPGGNVSLGLPATVAVPGLVACR